MPGLAGLAVVLWVVSGFIRDRQLGRAQSGTPAGTPAGGDRKQKELPPTSAAAPGGSPLDDDLADIEALLKKRGIQ